MAMNTYAAQNVPNGSANPQYFINKDLLDSADTFQVIDKFAVEQTLPMNSNAFLASRRYLTGAPDATPTPEGTNKVSRTQIYEDFTTQMFRYMEQYQLSQQELKLTPFPALKGARTEMTKLVILDRERVRWNALLTIANKIYNSSAVTTIPGVNGPITPGRIQTIVRSILKAKGSYVSAGQGGVNKEGTNPTEQSLVFLGHTDLQPDVRALPGFQPAISLPDGKPKHKTHFGNWLNVEFYLSQEAPILTGGGAASTTLLNTAGVTDVYQNIIMAKNTIATVKLGGAGEEGGGNLDTKLLDQPDKYDPGNQWANLVCTWWDAAYIITNDWAWLYYTGATLNP
jgi:N4-gp56 family major capsid protein